jgi:hypothetical protein
VILASAQGVITSLHFWVVLGVLIVFLSIAALRADWISLLLIGMWARLEGHLRIGLQRLLLAVSLVLAYVVVRTMLLGMSVGVFILWKRLTAALLLLWIALVLRALLDKRLGRVGRLVCHVYFPMRY